MLRGQPSFSDTPMIPPQQQGFTPTPAANPNGYRLPRAMAAAGSQPQPQPSPQIQAPTLPPQESVPRAAPDPVMAQYEDLSRRRAAAEAEMDKTYAPVDRAAATKAYQEHVEGGDRALTLALAASQAGDRFKPLQQQFLKQYGEAQAPMHVAGGIYTPQGFIEDVDKVSTQNQQRLQARLASLDNALNVNLTAQERVRIEAMKEDTQRQLHQLMVGTQVAIAQAMSADRRYAAELAHADRQAALDAKTATGKGTVDPQHLIDLVGEARKFLPQATSSGAGALVDQGAAFFGHATTGSQATARLNAIGGQLVMAQPRLEGPQSDKDTMLYKQMAGNVADPHLPTADRMAALDTIEAISKKYLSGEFVPPTPQRGVPHPRAAASAAGAPNAGKTVSWEHL
jgi:hypothetical protein